MWILVCKYLGTVSMQCLNLICFGLCFRMTFDREWGEIKGQKHARIVLASFTRLLPTPMNLSEKSEKNSLNRKT